MSASEPEAFPRELREIAEKYFKARQLQLGETEPVLKLGCADSPYRFSLLDSGSDQVAYIAWSNEQFPFAVDTAAQAALSAAERIGPELAQRVLSPDETGMCLGRSYAIYPWRESLGRIALGLAKRSFLRKQLLPWLAEVTRVTCHIPDQEEIEELFRKPLNSMACSTVLPARLRREAETTLLALEQGRFSPRNVLSHGDLWIDNILFSRVYRLPISAVVIDWGGCRHLGHPLFDLLRLSDDLALGAPLLRDQIALHCQALGVPIEQSPMHLIASLAFLKHNLGEFEVHRYVEVCDSMLERLRFAGLRESTERNESVA